MLSDEDKKEVEGGGLYIHPRTQPLFRFGFKVWKQESGQLYVECDPVLVRQHLSCSLHELADDSFFRRSEHQSTIFQCNPFSHSHHSLCRPFIAQPCHSISIVFETRGGSHRTNSVPLHCRYFGRKKETIHVRLVFVFSCFQKKAERTADSMLSLNGVFSVKRRLGKRGTLHHQLVC